MIDEKKLAEVKAQVMAEADKSEKMFIELFKSVGMKEDIAQKIAATLTDLTLLSQLFTKMGMPITEIKQIFGMEFARFTDTEPGVKEELNRVLSNPKGMEMFIKAIKIQNVKQAEEDLIRMKEDLDKPFTLPVQSPESDVTVIPPSPTIH